MGLYKLENFHSNDLVNKHVAKFRGYKMRNYTEFIQAVNVIKQAGLYFEVHVEIAFTCSILSKAILVDTGLDNFSKLLFCGKKF